jgi:hypothetical protein
VKRICLVRGVDHRGLPKWVIVEAASLHEAAARATDEIRRDGGDPSDLEVTMHEPKSAWTVTQD